MVGGNMIKLIKKGKNTYIKNGKDLIRVNVYGRLKCMNMFGKQVEELTEKELKEFVKA